MRLFRITCCGEPRFVNPARVLDVLSVKGETRIYITGWELTDSLVADENLGVVVQLINEAMQ